MKMSLYSRMHPVRLLMQQHRQQQTPLLLFAPNLTKMSPATSFPSFSAIRKCSQDSFAYSFFCPKKQKIFLLSTSLVPRTKPLPVSFFCHRSQGIFTHSASSSRQGIGSNSESNVITNRLSDTAWGIRLANENGFLSWCRNGYLSTAVGVGMKSDASNTLVSLAYETVFFVAGLNITMGTSIFIFNILKMRHQIGLSTLGATGFVFAAIIHLCLWLFGILTYTGYIEHNLNLDEPKKQ